MTNSFKGIIPVIMLIIASLLILPGCSAPTHPIKVKIYFTDPPVLGKEVQVTATFEIVKDHFRNIIHGVDAKIQINEGFQLVNGDPEWQGDFEKGKVYSIRVTVKTIKTGTWLINARAQSETDAAVGYNGLFVTVSEKDVQISDRSPSTGIHPPTLIDPPQSVNPSANGAFLPLKLSLSFG